MTVPIPTDRDTDYRCPRCGHEPEVGTADKQHGLVGTDGLSTDVSCGSCARSFRLPLATERTR